MHALLLHHLSKHITLNPDEETLIRASFRPKLLRRKEYLQQQGDISRYETFVTKGCLRAYSIDEKGEEHIVQFAVEDWWIGDLYSFLTQTPSLYTIEALEDCDLLQIDKPALEALYLNVPKMERFFRLIIQNAFIASQKRILSRLSKPAEERYIEFLNRYPNIEQRIPQYQVAAYLGMSPEFLSRIRKRFARK